MSAESIARWNAIPLARPDPHNDAQHPLKRPRPEDDDNGDESDDDVSIVSRSPSPTPAASDAMDIDKYDEYVQRPEQEVVTVETRIKHSNKGFLMLANMGWVEGQPLGLSGDGRVDPVPFYVKNDLTGLGKANQDVRMIESTVAQRRELDSERQTKETEEQRKAREGEVAKRAALQSEISTTLRAFYCELCDKQFQNVAQYDEHTNSYAHHHKARFRDMQATQRANRNTQEEMDRRKEKERKREEKELRKIAKAAGVKMAKPPVALVAPVTELGTNSGGEAEAKSTVFKKSGWATVSSSAPAVNPVSSTSTDFSRTTANGPALIPSSSASSSGWASFPTTLNPGPRQSESDANMGRTPDGYSPAGPAPAFRTGGWTSLDTGSSVMGPPRSSPTPPTPLVPFLPSPSSSIVPPPPQSMIIPPPASASTSFGWSSAPSSSAPQLSRSNWPQTSAAQVPPAPVLPDPPIISTEPPSALEPQVRSRPKQPKAPARQEASRSGWQQFRAGAPGRRK
ncbi:hypothetical protein B0H21DRAFT_723656 [Amylocystis lapponica]|nr:hypothetical protein B0H21DRAFT_723656 [Amylocystis lapponica]